MKRIFLILIILSFVVSSAFAAGGTRLLHQPDISVDKIVFVYGGDLWIVPISGGEAKRLTTHLGSESSPKFSPDGRWIAFSAQYDGNTDIYVVSADGGLKRLVWMPKSLKEEIRERFEKRAEELGVPDLLDKIADETVATTEEEVLAYITEKKHPVLEMESLF